MLHYAGWRSFAKKRINNHFKTTGYGSFSDPAGNKGKITLSTAWKY